MPRSWFCAVSVALLIACNGGTSSLPGRSIQAVELGNPYLSPAPGDGAAGAAGQGSAGAGGSVAGGAGVASGGAGPGLPPSNEPWCDQPPAASPPQAPMTSQGCSLVGGVWDITLDTWNNAPPVTMKFDEAGRFVLSAQGTDPCAASKLHGLYRLDEGLFTIVTTEGKGSGCYMNSSSAHFIHFSGDCSEATLEVHLDACTGAGLLQGGGAMKRRD